MLKTMFPIELLRTVLGLIGIGSAFCGTPWYWAN
jgi:hypothetical protein